eukprot:CAMPEP_0184988326 /NCGR_PEP_ID=MMETSP1098-20130426/23995_1 /TAXON_ID=89044 /ORGANISM="Spumella elongata, Strain CCAP 955/1" /LENGTH=60 /DNA_ID=CAMNT_0027513053 /DNA_START=96 /DNA_END=275 /DNA_ORIENTATION=-
MTSVIGKSGTSDTTSPSSGGFSNGAFSVKSSTGECSAKGCVWSALGRASSGKAVALHFLT